MNIYSEDKMYESYSSEVERMQKCIDELQQENQELKLELSGYRQAILKDKEMLGLKEENDKLKKQLEEKNKPQMFIDTQDMEERYAEELYQDFLKEENKQLKDKLSKIETLIINHNCDTGDIYYKYNSKFLKSELKQRILEIVYEQRSDK